MTESKDTAPSLWKLLKMAKSLSGCFCFCFCFPLGMSLDYAESSYSPDSNLVLALPDDT